MVKADHRHHYWQGKCKYCYSNYVSWRFLPYAFAAGNCKIGNDEDHISNNVQVERDVCAIAFFSQWTIKLNNVYTYFMNGHICSNTTKVL